MFTLQENQIWESIRFTEERIFPYYSPLIESIALVRKGQVRRAKLYFMRKRIGKAARVEERVMTREQREQKEASKKQ